MFDKKPWDWQWDLEEGSLPQMPDLIKALQGHDDLNALVPGLSLRGEEGLSSLNAEMSALDCVGQLLHCALDKCCGFVALHTHVPACVSRSGDGAGDEVEYAVVGPQKVERDSATFQLQVWAMIDAQVNRFALTESKAQ
eukprot:188203-Prymnesium_polylepis.1